MAPLKDVYDKIKIRLKAYPKVLLPYYKEKFREKHRMLYYKYPRTTFFGTFFAITAPIAEIGCYLVNRRFQPLGVYAVPAIILSFAFLFDIDEK